MQTDVSCSTCGAVLPKDWAHQSADHPCPQCGSLQKVVHLHITEAVNVEIHDSIRGKVKDKTLPSKKNPRVDFFAGDDLRKSDGTWMKKERVLDRDNNRYRETVVDPKTGEVIHQTDEPLSEHIGHGSAKPKQNGDA